jgi:CRISPR/Cas system CSM-associated protein Csm3 (group 7 of RAMP superfamily)
MESRPYRTIFCADLVQDSAMSVGGRTGLDADVDDVFCRDGRGEIVLRGEGLGGALIATARRIFGLVPKCITSGFGATSTARSRWNLYNSHAQGTPRLEIRQSVGLRQDTGARAEGVLFDIETSPRLTRWPFMLEVDTFEAGNAQDGAIAEYMAAQALLEWERHRCWLGRSVARGLGWAHLEKLRAYRLTTEAAERWPDSSDRPDAVLARINPAPIEAKEFVTRISKPASTPHIARPWYYVDLRGTLCVGESQSGYGLDVLSVGGQVADLPEAALLGHFLRPTSLAEAAFVKGFEPDSTFALTRNPLTGEPEPFLPGSGLRGPLRHAFSRLLRAEGQDIRDPNVDRQPRKSPDLAETLFGTTKRSAAILVMDAHLAEGSDWEAALLHQHAENEFTGSVYGSGLYRRTVLTSALFDWRIVVEYQEDPAMTRAVGEALATVLDLGKCRHLPIGGARWRGAGWPGWQVNELSWGQAGEPEDRR